MRIYFRNPRFQGIGMQKRYHSCMDKKRVQKLKRAEESSVRVPKTINHTEEYIVNGVYRKRRCPDATTEKMSK